MINKTGKAGKALVEIIAGWKSGFLENGMGSILLGKSLVSRILLLQLVWATAVFTLIGAGLWIGLGVLVDQSLDREARQWARELDNIGTRLYVSRSRNIRKFENRVSHWDEFSYVRYLDSKASKVLFQYHRSGDDTSQFPLPGKEVSNDLHFDQQGTRPTRVQAYQGSSVVRYMLPVRVRTMRAGNLLDFDPDKVDKELFKVIGYIEFGVDRARYMQAVTEVLYSAGIGIVLLFIFSIIVGRTMIRRGLAPLSELKDPLARLARGERNLLVEHTGDEELDAIIEALNATINAVRERDNSLRRMAEYDSLTGLANRSCFTSELEEEVARIARGTKSSALFFVDLDQFKYINDTLGHAAGDRLLTQVAKALKTRMRDSDVIARFGGDEFTVLARDIDQGSAASLAQSLLKMLQDMRFVEGDSSLHVHCSIGMTMIDSRKYTAQEFLAQADMACHQAKTRGRNCVSIYEEGEDNQGKMQADMSWSQAILSALENDRFVLHFQPIVGGDREKTEKYEVLLRMIDQEGELVPPGAFLSSAERFGLMPKIDCWVISKALAQLAEIRNSNRNVEFFINLSGHVFQSTGTLKFIRDQLEKYKLPKGSICFEITEQVAVQHLEEASLLMRSLQKIGCQFALDDFGAGFSSLNYIKALPIDFIKIDGSFISNMRQDPIDQAMVQSFVQIGRTLGKKTVAEYVENLETLVMLKKLGVDYVQGFYVGKPEAAICDKRLTLRKVRSQG